MDLRVVSFPTPQENVLFDQVLFDMAEAGLGEEALRFWESDKTFIVLGKTSKENNELVADHVKRDNVPVLRRMSAGGVVVQGKGCLNFTLVLSKEKNPQLVTIPSSYTWILDKVISAINILGIQTSFFPPCDIALTEGQLKISGNAQKRGKKFILHHGTLLHHFDIDLVHRYLQIPLKMPFYRKGRSHQDFMANIDRDPKDIIDAFIRLFPIERKNHHVTAQELAHLQQLMAQGKF